MQESNEFKVLGKTTREASRDLDIFPRPDHVQKVVLETSEVTSLCPVTGQPDWQDVCIEYGPDGYCIESKSLKLYLWSYRDVGIFCEALSSQIARDICAACNPRWCRVTVKQSPRGGIAITSVALEGNPD